VRRGRAAEEARRALEQRGEGALGAGPPPRAHRTPAHARHGGAPAGDDALLADVAAGEQESADQEQRREVEDQLRVAADGSLSTHELGSVGGWGARALPLADGRVGLVGDQVRIVDLS